MVTDSETGNYKIGDIDGGSFPDGFLEKYIKNHGAERLLEKLASMTSAVITVKYKIKREQNEVLCSNNISNE